MKGVLIIAHGSRRTETQETMNYIINLTKKQLSDIEIVSSYMEFSTPNVLDGLEELKNKGVNKILVVPYFLFKGIHIQEDIPEELDKFRADNPNIELTMGNVLGKDPRLADILVERIEEIF